LRSQPSESVGGDVVAGGGAASQPDLITPLGQQPGQPEPSILVAQVGAAGQ
jgi:hypothetical protein